VGNFDLIGGQIGPEKIVDDGNLTAFIIRYRFGLTWRMLTHVRLIQSRHSLYDHLVFDF
jgi:hypothetical protein